MNKKDPDIVAEAKQYALDALKTARDIMKDKRAPHAARLTACSIILDRAYGKAPQALAINDPDKMLTELPRSITVVAKSPALPMPPKVLQ